MDITLDIAALIAAVAWPLILLVVLLMYRPSVENLLTNFGQNPVQSVELPFLGAVQFAVAEPIMGRQDPFAEVFRQPTPVGTVVGGSAGSVIESQLSDETSAEYAIINLGEGTSWLTSRLYILALLLHRMRSVRLLIFVETAQGVRQRFVGFAETARVRWALAQRYVWLEESFGIAYRAIMRDEPNAFFPTSTPPFRIASRDGRLVGPYEPANIYPASRVLHDFLVQVQRDAPPQGFKDNAWVPLRQSTGYEHAQWVDAPLIEEVLDKDLVTSYVRSIELKGKSGSEQARIILSEQARYVALTQENMRFEQLIDRQPLLEKVAQNLLEESGA